MRIAAAVVVPVCANQLMQLVNTWQIPLTGMQESRVLETLQRTLDLPYAPAAVIESAEVDRFCADFYFAPDGHIDTASLSRYE